LHNYLAYCLLKAFRLVSVFSCCFNLNAYTSRCLSEVAAKSLLIVRLDNDNKVFVTKLALYLLNKVKDS
jgi:hypothetical protein